MKWFSVLLYFTVTISTCLGDYYTNAWAVHIEGGLQTAKRLAEKHGFVYIDQVYIVCIILYLGPTCSFTCQTLAVVGLVSPFHLVHFCNFYWTDLCSLSVVYLWLTLLICIFSAKVRQRYFKV